MTTITQELERTAHDIVSGPNFRETAEIAIAGGLVGGALGWLRATLAKSGGAKSEAIKCASWGAGIGIVGQYMIFHMLKPSMRQFARSSLSAAALHAAGQHHYVGAPWPRFGHGGFGHGGGFDHGHGGWGHGGHEQQHHLGRQVCPPGTMFDVMSGRCMPMGM